MRIQKRITMSVNSVHQNIEALKAWQEQLNKGKKGGKNKNVKQEKNKEEEEK